MPAADESDEEDPIPVLVSGPTPAKGLPFLPPNAIKYYRAVYELPTRSVIVYHSYREVVPLSEWGRRNCGGQGIRTFETAVAELQEELPPGPSGEVPNRVVHTGFYRGDRYSLFFTFTDGDISCRFVEEFIRRYLYFRNTSSRRADSSGTDADGVEEEGSDDTLREQPPPPFPAILE